MLKTCDLIDNMEGTESEKYISMLKEVNIPDFTKCIAQFSGLNISKIPDAVIKSYLITWATNKYNFYKMLGNKTRLDVAFEYNRQRQDIENEINDISKKFPIFALWLKGFTRQINNKIEAYKIGYEVRDAIKDLFPQYRLDGSSITHFFKSCLNAPDELVTEIGKIFENQKVKANYTISIDPVDMMLASENPYDWTSCYRLELNRDDSHADGCLAAVLDNASLITYVWNNEGKFDLYDTYKFKNIRYKRMRQWIALSPNMTSIHFNCIYPGKDYDEDFEKELREIVEEVVAKCHNKENKWKKNWDCNCYREHGYGYSEYSDERIWTLKDTKNETEFTVFNEEILCPCGCGDFLPPTYPDDEAEADYNGEGFVAEHFNMRYWCDLADDYCREGCTSCCECNCSDCGYWQDEHPQCDLDNEECDNPSFRYIDDGVMCSNYDHCKDCPRYKEEMEEESENNDSLVTHFTTEDLNTEIKKIVDKQVESALTEGITTTISPYATNYLCNWNIITNMEDDENA
ncbi:MAG: hypothetical protein ACI4PE_03435 [Bacilli bacterium]